MTGDDVTVLWQFIPALPDNLGPEERSESAVRGGYLHLQPPRLLTLQAFPQLLHQYAHIRRFLQMEVVNSSGIKVGHILPVRIL